MIRKNQSKWRVYIAAYANMKAIFVVMNTTWAVIVKIRPEKNSGMYGIWIFLSFFVCFFFRPSFHYCSSSVHYCEDRFHITSLSAVHIYDFYIFTVISAYHIINYLPCMWLIYGLKHSKLRFYTRLNLYIELKMAGLPVFDKVGGSSLWIRPSKRKHLKLR